MKKLLLGSAVIASLCFAPGAKAQLLDESNVTITMDLQPILQLDMSGPQNVDFVFDQISEYVGGITQYGVTTLKVSSTVNWDLYAVGFGNNVSASTGGAIWDQQAIYGSGGDTAAVDSISCNVLELHQYPADSSVAGATGGIAVDYSAPFVLGASALGTNSIYASITPYTKPGVADKYIAGHNSTGAYVVGGTYLTQGGTPGPVTGAQGVGSNYYYIIDYRIVPGLPAVFPNSSNNIAPGLWNGLVGGNSAYNFAQPGLYTMNVKYVLTENN